MSITTPVFRDSLLSAKRRLVEGREKIKQQHAGGSPGIQVCACLTDLFDTVILDLYETALAEMGSEGEVLRSRIAIVPHGGYGRRDVAPYSDVDLMILCMPGDDNAVEPLAKRLLRDVFDVGLTLGQTVRTADDACRRATKDPTIFTSLVEARYLAGSVKLYSTFAQKFARTAKKHSRKLCAEIAQARREERVQYGETVYLLEPNIKRSRGGLRDIQLARWIGFARYGIAEPEVLQARGFLPKEDQRVIRRASEYLLRLRNELHFQAGKPQDVLNRAEQVRLAPLYGYQDKEGLLAVEQFMQEYFRHTKTVRSITSNFNAGAQPGRALNAVLGSLFSRQVDGDYRITPHTIVATKSGLGKLTTDLSETLRLTELANAYDKRIAHSTWEAVRAAVPTFAGEDVNAETARRFLSLITQPGRLGEMLRKLHELGVLEKIIPAFTHARYLLQFNEYHKYTVDEHCILAVQRATEFISDQGPLGRVYRGIKSKRTLHLALLIHDLGKGFLEDHSELGLRIAGEVGPRLRLPLRETETLKFLVHKHLAMSHLAFRRDTSDDEVILRFAVEVGSPEVLDMLFVLTAADISAVGPGVWNNWKAEVLADLHSRTMRHLAGESAVDSVERVSAQRNRVRESLGHPADATWFNRQIDALPTSYLFGSPPKRIAEELTMLHDLPAGEVRASGRYLPESKALEFVIGTREDITPGVFYKLTGALASQGLGILSAQINTLADGLVLDRFYVNDPDYAEQPPATRMEEVERALVNSLKTPQGDRPSFRRVWKSDSRRYREVLDRLPTRVLSDNSSSDRFTILDVFASDRRGLLYTIARTLFEQDLSVSIAKIGTYLDQVVDVFYVTDRSGHKVADEHRLNEIAAKLIAAIDSMQKE